MYQILFARKAQFLSEMLIQLRGITFYAHNLVYLHYFQFNFFF